MAASGLISPPVALLAGIIYGLSFAQTLEDPCASSDRPTGVRMSNARSAIIESKGLANSTTRAQEQIFGES